MGKPEVFDMIPQETIVLTPNNLERARADAAVLWEYVAASGLRVAERAPLDLTGRYHVGDGSEFGCEVTELTPQGLRVRGPKVGREGEGFVGHVEALGILEGAVVEAREQSFVVGIVGTPRWLRRLSERVIWQLRRAAQEVVERRASERVEMNSAAATLQTVEGASHACRIFDLSEGGAALHLGANALYFWVDQPVLFSGRAGRVLRLFPGGVVIKFEEA